MRLVPAVVDLLDASGIPFALIGAGAMAAYGVSRSTLDTDFFTTASSILSDDFWSSLQSTDTQVAVNRGDFDDPLAGVVRISRSDEIVDVVVGRFVWQNDAVKRAVRTTVNNVPLPVVELADLILLKLYAGGGQDMWDVRQLLDAHAETDLIGQVDSRMTSLPGDCVKAWSAVLAERS